MSAHPAAQRPSIVRLPRRGGVPSHAALRRAARQIAAAERPADRLHWEQRFIAAFEQGILAPSPALGGGAGGMLHDGFLVSPGPLNTAEAYAFLGDMTDRADGAFAVDVSDAEVGPEDTQKFQVGAARLIDLWRRAARGQRAASLTASLRADHPDLAAFLRVSDQASGLRRAVLIDDAFMERVEGAIRGGQGEVAVSAAQMLAAALVDGPVFAAFVGAAPPRSGLGLCPAGAQLAPRHGGYVSAAVNLAALTRHPFTADAYVDLDALQEAAAVGTRLLDDAIDAAAYPGPEYEAEAMAARRIALGVCGLGDALAMCGAWYGSPRALELTDLWMSTLRRAAAAASAALARARGPHQAPPGPRPRDPELAALAQEGLRNATLIGLGGAATIGGAQPGAQPAILSAHPWGAAALPGMSWAERTARELGLDPPDVLSRRPDRAERLAGAVAAQRWCDGVVEAPLPLTDADAPTDLLRILSSAWRSGARLARLERAPEVSSAAAAQAVAALKRPADATTGAEDLMKAVRRLQDLAPQNEALSRPSVLHGATYSAATSSGPIFVTVNSVDDQAGSPVCEVLLHSASARPDDPLFAAAASIGEALGAGADLVQIEQALAGVLQPEALSGARPIAAVLRVLRAHLRGC